MHTKKRGRNVIGIHSRQAEPRKCGIFRHANENNSQLFLNGAPLWDSFPAGFGEMSAGQTPSFRLVVTDVDDAVTLRLFLDESGTALGEVFAPSEALPAGRQHVTGPVPTPAPKAVALAVRIANKRRLEIAVIDPDDVWDSSWGKLG